MLSRETCPPVTNPKLIDKYITSDNVENYLTVRPNKWFGNLFETLAIHTSCFTTANNIIVAMLGETYSQEGTQYHQELHDEPENQHPRTGFKL
jgi:hypothetical protein